MPDWMSCLSRLSLYIVGVYALELASRGIHNCQLCLLNNDVVFSPRNKDDGDFCVEKEWGQCKQYADEELSRLVYHELEQDFRSARKLACRRAPALVHTLKTNPKAAREVRYVTTHFSTTKKYKARKYIYAGLYLKHLEGVGKARFLQQDAATAQCPVPLTVIGRDYDGPKTKLADGRTLHTWVHVTEQK